MNVYDFPQYSDEWWAVRRGVPTASKAECICTPAGKAMPAAADTYINKLIGDLRRADYGDEEKAQTVAMANGTAMEPRVRAMYEFLSGRDRVREVGFCMNDAGTFGCSPDALVGDDGGLELKSPEPHTQVGYLRAGELPPAYRPQVHFSMVVTGREWWDFVSWHADLPPLYLHIKRDEYTDQMAEAMDAFAAEYANVRERIEAMSR